MILDVKICIYLLYTLFIYNIFILYIMLYIIFIYISLYIYSLHVYMMKWGKEQVLRIIVIGVGHKQEITDFDGESQMVLSSPCIKKKKKKKKSSSSCLVSYPLLSRFLNRMILKKERKKPNQWSEYRCLSLPYFQ